MAEVKLSMTIDRIPAYADGTRPEMSDFRLCISDGHYHDFVSMLGASEKLDHSTLVKGLRAFAEVIEGRYGK